MPLVFTESRCLSLFLLATIEQKHYTRKEKSDGGGGAAPASVGCHSRQNACAAENVEIVMENITEFQSTDFFVLIPTAQLSVRSLSLLPVPDINV